MRHRGSVLDALFFGMLAFVLILVSFLVYYVTQTTMTTCETVGTSLGPLAAASNATLGCTQIKTAVGDFVGIIPFIIMAMGLSGVALASVAPAPAIFLPGGLLILIVGVVAFVQIQNIVPTVLATPILSAVAASYPLSANILSYIAWFVLVIGAAILVVHYRTNTPPSGGMPPGY